MLQTRTSLGPFVSFAVLTCLVPVGAANAQWARQTSFDVGAIRLTRDDFADTDGVNVAALWSRWSERISLIATGAATRVSDGRATGIGIGSASYAFPVRRVRIETGGTATVLGTSDLSASSSWMGFGRAHLLGSRGGVWIGGGGGGVHHEQTTVGASSGELGAWARRGRQRISLTAATVRTSVVETVIFDNQTVLRVRDRVGYSDATLAGHGAWRAFELDASTVVRNGGRGNVASGATAAVAGTWWVTPYVGLAAAVGRQLSDPMRGTARTRYATIALRLSAERHGPERLRPLPAPPAGETSLTAVPAGGDAAVVRVQAPGARSVELMGDVTGWEPVALERGPGGWVTRLTMPAGSHHVLLRVDGGPWLAPSNLPKIDDEFSGRVGLIVVP